MPQHHTHTDIALLTDNELDLVTGGSLTGPTRTFYDQQTGQIVTTPQDGPNGPFIW